MSEVTSNNQKERPFEPVCFVLNPDRKRLYNRIDQRVLNMINAGLLDEVKSVAHLRHLQSLNTVGYKEIFEHLNGNIDLNRAIELIQRNSRRYAKRQLTWFRRSENNIWIESEDTNKRVQVVENHLSK